MKDLEEIRKRFSMVKYNEYSVWRGKIINDIFKKYNYTKYLEIGYLEGLTFNQIECTKKVAVDPNPLNDNPCVIKETSDDFFGKNEEKFDVIFIDGYHEKNQVLRDFENSFNFLSENGLIILHDVNPFTIEGTKQTGNGDCYQTWMNLFENYKLKTYSNYYDTIGIFSKKLNSKQIKLELKEFSWSNFENERNKYIYDLQINDDLDIF